MGPRRHQYHRWYTMAVVSHEQAGEALVAVWACRTANLIAYCLIHPNEFELTGPSGHIAAPPPRCLCLTGAAHEALYEGFFLDQACMKQYCSMFATTARGA